MQPKTLDTLFLRDQRRPTTRPPVERRPSQTRQSTGPRQSEKMLATVRRLPQRIPLTKPRRSATRSQANPILSDNAGVISQTSSLRPPATRVEDLRVE